MAKIKLSDILETEALQRLQDSFAAITGITTVVLGPNAQPLTKTSNKRGFCAMMQRHPEGHLKCKAINENLCAENARTGEPASLMCPHSGLLTASVPIRVEGEYLGSWVIGQARVADPDPAVLGLTEQGLGLEEGSLDEVMRELPLISREQFDRAFAFLIEMSATVVKLGHARHDMAARNSELEQLAEQLDSSAQMLRHFIDSSDVGMYITDFETGEVLMVSEHFANLAGLAPEEAVGKTCWEIAGAGGGAWCPYCPRDRLLNGESYEWEYYNEKFGCWVRSVNQAIRWVDGRLAHMVTFWDITTQKQMQEELAQLAYIDQQLRLPNGLRLARDLGEGRANCFLVAFDIVLLRRINDTYGRDTGDELLRAVAEWVQNQKFAGTSLYRIEGDQFCLVFESEDDEAAKNLAADIHARFTEPWQLALGGQALSILCGVSVAIVDARAVPAQDSVLNILARALDVANNEQRIVVHDNKMDETFRNHFEFERELRRCVNNAFEGFEVHFQPIVELASGTWKGLEALCRWESPVLGRFSPLVFIQEAEQLGLIGALGDWVLETAVAQCKEWGLDKVEGFYLSVNASPLQMLDEGFPARVLLLLNFYGYPSRKLSLEVTETTEVTFSERTMDIIERLRSAGVRMALDDFGTGYSSFNNLKHLPVSYLKTEKAFIEGIEQDSYMQYFYYIMAQLAHATNMKLIAEGVETREQLEIILKNGADYVQGYYFSRPLPPAELALRLDEFTHPNRAFFSIKPENISGEELFNSSESYIATPGLFRMINRSMHCLLTEESLDDAFQEVLTIVGGGLHVSRAYIFQQDAGAVYSNTHEWCAPGISPQKQNLAKVDVDGLVPGWLAALREDGMIVASDIGTLPADISGALAAQGICAVAVLPIWDDGQLVAFAGFDDANNREWLPEEIILLRNLCIMMGSSVRRHRLERELERRNEMLEDVLNSLELGICITDPDTEDVLWANETLGGVFSGNSVSVGEKCYTALRGEKEHCPDCRRDELLDNPKLKKVEYEHYNRRKDRYYAVHESLIRWVGGKVAHLEYVRDTTEMRKAQQKLEYYASTDVLTGSLNRKSLLEALQKRMDEDREAGMVFSLVFIDVDHLKFVNDVYGHTHGDLMLQQVVKVLEKVMQPGDVLGRLGGDEFLAILPGRGRKEADALMARALKALRRLPADDIPEEYSFSYGVCESDEIEGAGKQRLDTLLAKADGRMRQFKWESEVSG